MCRHARPPDAWSFTRTRLHPACTSGISPTCNPGWEISSFSYHTACIETWSTLAVGSGMVLDGLGEPACSLSCWTTTAKSLPCERGDAPVLSGDCSGAWRETELLHHGKRVRHDGVFEDFAVTHGVNVDRHPRDAIARIETMALMANLNLPEQAVRRQLASAIQLIVQIARFNDGSRRVTHVTEISGMEDDVVSMQEILYSISKVYRRMEE